MNERIGIIGFGNMGRVIGEQLKSDYQIFIFDKDKEKTIGVSMITVCGSIIELIEKVDIVILAVKPQNFDAVLTEINPAPARRDGIKGRIKNKLVISIAAGIPTKYIEQVLGVVRVVRVMPNMPVKVNAGITCLSKGKFAGEEDLDFVKNLFGCLGTTLIIEEKLMNADTAISGSGPGFLYDWGEGKTIEEIKKYAENIFIPSLIASAEKQGFSQQQAKILAESTARGSIAVLEKTKLPAGELKQQVASKGGTTEAGLEVLHKGGTLEDAVKAAVKRAEELSKRS